MCRGWWWRRRIRSGVRGDEAQAEGGGGGAETVVDGGRAGVFGEEGEGGGYWGVMGYGRATLERGRGWKAEKGVGRVILVLAVFGQRTSGQTSPNSRLASRARPFANMCQ